MELEIECGKRSRHGDVPRQSEAVCWAKTKRRRSDSASPCCLLPNRLCFCFLFRLQASASSCCLIFSLPSASVLRRSPSASQLTVKHVRHFQPQPQSGSQSAVSEEGHLTGEISCLLGVAGESDTSVAAVAEAIRVQYGV